MFATTPATPCVAPIPNLAEILQPESITVPGTSIETERPFTTTAAPTSTMFLGRMDAKRASALLEPHCLKPVSLAGQAVVAATGFNYTVTPSGAYNEAVVTILASQDGQVRFADLASCLQFFEAPLAMTKGDLLQMPDVPFVFAATDLFLDKQEPVDVGRGLMHLPKHLTKVLFTGNDPNSQTLAVYDQVDGREHFFLSAQHRAGLPVVLREAGIFGKPAQWMRFRVATRLPEDTGTNTHVAVVVHAGKMTLDIFPRRGFLAFQGPYARRYGDVSLLGALRFTDLQAGFNYPEPV